jgi:hypothetical protein
MVQDAHFIQRQAGDDPAMRVDDGGDARIGRANERQPLFDGPHAGLMQMLIGSRRCAKPGIIRQIE